MVEKHGARRGAPASSFQPSRVRVTVDGAHRLPMPGRGLGAAAGGRRWERGAHHSERVARGGVGRGRESTRVGRTWWLRREGCRGFDAPGYIGARNVLKHTVEACDTKPVGSRRARVGCGQRKQSDLNGPDRLRTARGQSNPARSKTVVLLFQCRGHCCPW